MRWLINSLSLSWAQRQITQLAAKWMAATDEAPLNPRVEIADSPSVTLGERIWAASMIGPSLTLALLSVWLKSLSEVFPVQEFRTRRVRALGGLIAECESFKAVSQLESCPSSFCMSLLAAYSVLSFSRGLYLGSIRDLLGGRLS